MTQSSVGWRRSTYCANNSCVEVAFLDNQIAVRDSKDQNGPMLRFTQAEWTAFLDGARNGEFDVISNRAR
jgi:Domain of unknown function (DUF397)